MAENTGSLPTMENIFIDVEIKIKRLTETAKLPSMAYPHDAAFDIYCDEQVIIHPYETVKVKTGIASVITPGFRVILKDKSSVAENGVSVLAGVIDSGYRGEWTVVLCNHSDDVFVRNKGTKIAQAMVSKVPSARIEEVEEFSAEDQSERGEGGFGSSGE